MIATARFVRPIAVLALSLSPALAAADPVDPPASPAEPPPVTLLGAPILPPEGPRTGTPMQHPLPVPFPVATPIAAGWRDDMFFLSDPSHDWFVSPGGRLQVDFQTFSPVGITASRGLRTNQLQTGFVLRRARLELVGGVLSFLTWRLGAELTDQGPQSAADLLLNLRVRPWFNVQLGQFDAPFTLENRTSDRYLDFPERSLTVRALGVPTGKEIGLMLWGEDRRRLAHGSIGLFNGGGPNRLSPGNQVEAMARVFFHPFMVSHPHGIGRLIQFGASARVAHRSVAGQGPYPTMTTPGGGTLFNPAIAPDVTIVAQGLQWAVAAELDLPLHRFDLRGEFVYVHNDTGEVATPVTGTFGRDPLRLGSLEGFGFYTQVGYWILGLPGSAVRPGYQDPPTLRLDRPQPLTLPFGLQVVARFDTIQFAYRGSSVDPRGLPDSAASGQYRVLAAEFGINVWLTRHLRFLLDYRHYWFTDQTAEPGVDLNRMHGPAIHPGAFGEFSTRAAINL